MRRSVKVALGVIAGIAIAFAALAGTGIYFVFRGMDTRVASERDAVQAIDAVKAVYGTRPPLIEVVDPARADIRINRPDTVSPAAVSTVHIINWKRDDGEMMRTAVPLWLLRFSSVNILSQLGVAPERFRLTVRDIERYGPGVIVDYNAQGAFRLLMWVD